MRRADSCRRARDEVRDRARAGLRRRVPGAAPRAVPVAARRAPLPPRARTRGPARRVAGRGASRPRSASASPWRFVTVEAPARRAAVRASFEDCNAEALAGQHAGRAALYARLKLAGLDEAPCHLAVFVEPDPEQGHGLGRRTMPETVAYSAVMAVHTFWLAARAGGLGPGLGVDPRPGGCRGGAGCAGGLDARRLLLPGLPAADSDAPELECAGWEHRRTAAACLVRR